MSLPTYINSQDDNFFSFESLLTDLDSLYFQSLKDTEGLSEKAHLLNVKEDVSKTPYECFNASVDFQPEASEKIRAESMSTILGRITETSNRIRESTKEYHIRNSLKMLNYLENRTYPNFAIKAGEYTLS